MPSPQGDPRPEATEAAYRACVQTALIAALFSAAVCAILIANFVRGRATFPVDPPALVALKAELARRPEDETLKERIRKLDRDIRRDYFRRKALAHGGNVLLLAGVALFVASLKGAKRLRRKLPKPGPPPEDPWEAAGVSRVATLGVGALCLGGLVLLGAGASTDIAREYARAVGVTERAGGGRRGASERELARQWPQFRGPGGAASAPFARPPDRWNGATGENVLWKAGVPLPGESSPIVWDDRVFVTGADEKQREVFCFSARDGKLMWRLPVGAGSTGGGTPNVSPDTGYAAPTPATDGERVFALFATGHLACVSLDGRLEWLRHLGVPENMYGHASSPIVHNGRVIVQYDQGTSPEDGKSALLALDAATGQTVWAAKRPVPNSWSTPIVVRAGRREEIVTCGNPWVIGYDPATGAERWRVECLGGDVAPSPVFAGGLVFACNIGAQLAAIRPGGEGDVSRSAIAWSALDGLPDITSPASNGELVFLVTTDGLMTCYDARNGAKVWEHAFERTFRASPVIAQGRLFALDAEGVMHIVEAGRSFRELGTAPLGEAADATPAFAGTRVYIRGKEHLYCIGR